MILLICRLKNFIETINIEIIVQLKCDRPLNDLRKKGEVAYWSKILKFFMAQVSFLSCRTDNGQLEKIRYQSSRKGKV